ACKGVRPPRALAGLSPRPSQTTRITFMAPKPSPKHILNINSLTGGCSIKDIKELIAGDAWLARALSVAAR
ncbi:MAG: hypothetical protein QW512_05700, partial [Thermofilaceae archaeon]